MYKEGKTHILRRRGKYDNVLCPFGATCAVSLGSPLAIGTSPFSRVGVATKMCKRVGGSSRYCGCESVFILREGERDWRMSFKKFSERIVLGLKQPFSEVQHYQFSRERQSQHEAGHFPTHMGVNAGTYGAERFRLNAAFPPLWNRRK
ncbi:hypothetical protein, unlikely [Trypanosoma brucei gambiense DAL972]|uniref:Uncharacterized protein n=1 Tax=Trypanosoma brucei gambiense (strain MHOM/CI/86/DAL972) TaxID=679716 RepID=D0A206_TRYB9|nr:hypothetical protein, unlikely [Trypanosoma brucei gambiense DAL972]CBH15299.1 hypothetical protein, unlikely [Trypanosoma brucei gambiense DAL972]|eukprot:XP_011777564.1 hypothetical protein, unlikely [Trypanosoma brucei gambiense DAL972]